MRARDQASPSFMYILAASAEISRAQVARLAIPPAISWAPISRRPTRSDPRPACLSPRREVLSKTSPFFDLGWNSLATSADKRWKKASPFARTARRRRSSRFIRSPGVADSPRSCPAYAVVSGAEAVRTGSVGRIVADVYGAEPLRGHVQRRIPRRRFLSPAAAGNHDQSDGRSWARCTRRIALVRDVVRSRGADRDLSAQRSGAPQRTHC